MRLTGIILHISSLPNKYGIGTLGKSAYEFVDFLNKANQRLWQILPLGPTSIGDSPYQTFSAFAGNPYFIDLDILNKKKLLTKDEYAFLKTDENGINYKKLYYNRFTVLRLAYNRFRHNDNSDYQAFLKENAFWLDDYALFMSIKMEYNVEWLKWPTQLKMRNTTVLKKYKEENTDEIGFWKFIQFEFYSEWCELKKYAISKQVKIIGDMPIYVAMDSSDVWAKPKLWQLDDDLYPISVAGCPPDYFSDTGQLWGNPLYNYKKMSANNYNWWNKRLAVAYKLFDIVRIDHFRGFESYYAIPYGMTDAKIGRWEKGPGIDLFKSLKNNFTSGNIIAEDLGFLTEEVYKLLASTGFPGMKILQFAFEGTDDSLYLPHNHLKNCVVYTGTHDNNTLKGWYEKLSVIQKERIRKYIGVKNDKHILDKIIRLALASVADTVIIPIQDYLELDETARMNTPSTLGDNWQFRVSKSSLNTRLASRLSELTKIYYRNI